VLSLSLSTLRTVLFVSHLSMSRSPVSVWPSRPCSGAKASNISVLPVAVRPVKNLLP